MVNRFLIIGLFLAGVLIISCQKDNQNPVDTGLTSVPYQPIIYDPPIPSNFPGMVQPADNPMTVDGIQLGRMLFYDPILSIDSTLSCSSCHLQAGNFTDNLPFSFGVNQAMTLRSSMSLVDIGFHKDGLFWDGRSASIEELSLLPIVDPLEMQNTWEKVEEDLRQHPEYPVAFRKAFGITSTQEINRDLATKSIAQFLRSMISSGQSRYDKFARGEAGMTEKEIDGFLMFFDLRPGELPDAECGHCHAAPLFTTNEFFNNGITASPDFQGFPDQGRGAITGDPTENGKFKVPSLRNISLSPPYMHDGRFQTLEEVIDHYNSGGKQSPNKHPLIAPLGLNTYQKEALLAFLQTLTDTSFLQNPEYSDPHH